MLCNDESAVEVIGPVDRGERMIAKKGVRSIVRSISLMSGGRQAISGAWTRRLALDTLDGALQLMKSRHQLHLSATSPRRQRA